jgi:hypothetical protein
MRKGADLNKVVRDAAARFVKKEFGQFLERLEAEGQKFGAALGFERGPRMIRDVQRELQFWNSIGIDFHNWQSGARRTGEYYRVACLEGLDVLLRPIDHVNCGSEVKFALELLEEYHALLRHSALKAGPAPDSTDFAVWLHSKKKREADEVSRLEAALAQTKRELSAARAAVNP